MPNIGNREAIGDKKMKKLSTTLFLFLNILQTFAAMPPRDDRDTGGGFGSFFLAIGALIFIFWFFGDNDK